MSEPSIELRGLEARDIDAVLTIQSAAPEAAQWQHEAYEAILNGGPERLILAECSTTLVGFASYRVVASEAELLNLAVLPAFPRDAAACSLDPEFSDFIISVLVEQRQWPL